MTPDRAWVVPGRRRKRSERFAISSPAGVTNRPPDAPSVAEDPTAVPHTNAPPAVGGAPRLKGPTVPTRPAAQQTDARNHLHDVDSAADYLRCGRRLIYRLVAERKVKFTYAGRSLRFWQSDLDAYLDARAVEPLGAADLRR